MENDLVKRLMWSGLLAGVGALASIVANRIATAIWSACSTRTRRRLMADEPRARRRSPTRVRPAHRPLGETAVTRRSSDSDAFAERPEVFVGAAFAGGFALAVVLRRLAR